MNRLLLAGLVVAGWTAAGMGQTAPPSPMPPVGAGVQGTITTQPATAGTGATVTGTVTNTGLMPVPVVSGGRVMQGGYIVTPGMMVGGGMMQAGYTGAISGVVTGNCGLTTGTVPMTMTSGTMVNTTGTRYDGGRRGLLRRR